MTHFPASDLDHTECYKLLTGLVVPRPIGWVATTSVDGHHNLAPYSFFQAVASNPPVVIFSAGISDGHEKDSLVNVRATGEFTCNLVDMAVAEGMNASAAELDPQASEFDFAGLTPEPSVLVKAPRVAEAKASFECRLQQIVELGDDPMRHAVVFGEIVGFNVDDEVLDGTRIRFDQLDAVGRMAGNSYATTRDRFDLIRPQ